MLLLDYLQVKKPRINFNSYFNYLEKHLPTPEQKSYHAFTIKDEWIVGYGMDNDKGHMRNFHRFTSIWAL